MKENETSPIIATLRREILSGKYLSFFGAAIGATLLLQVTIVTDTIIVGQLLGSVPMSGVRVASPIVNILNVLAMLIGAQRPTVTIALQRLARAGLLIREATDRWLLTNHAIERLGSPCAPRAIVEHPAIGQMYTHLLVLSVHLCFSLSASPAARRK
jgi:hypothetical protein